MPSRRKVLLGAGAMVSVAGLGVVRAWALSTEPLAPVDLEALSLACGGQSAHTQLLADARLLLDDAIKRGVKPADATETVVCPLCHCAFQVAPDISF
ncbi:hypothetical protein [Dongia rigui]|uniref:Uncharacterized protein n=1 Tax=Dongia rigui TaxID=940149 RepID=A0ABU5DTG0_9PROT|nr:hypothetical protein [Dongia rigui]MDY0870322.1 hypothetical protein [Dongia rigui]